MNLEADYVVSERPLAAIARTSRVSVKHSGSSRYLILRKLFLLGRQTQWRPTLLDVPELAGCGLRALRPKRLRRASIRTHDEMRVEIVDLGKYVSDIAEPRRMNANYHCHVPELRSRLGFRE